MEGGARSTAFWRRHVKDLHIKLLLIVRIYIAQDIYIYCTNLYSPNIYIYCFKSSYDSSDCACQCIADFELASTAAIVRASFCQFSSLYLSLVLYLISFNSSYSTCNFMSVFQPVHQPIFSISVASTAVIVRASLCLFSSLCLSLGFCLSGFYRTVRAGLCLFSSLLQLSFYISVSSNCTSKFMSVFHPT